MPRTSTKLAKGDKSMLVKWNEEYQVDLIAMTRAHLVLTTFSFFRKGIEESSLDPNGKKHLTTLCKIFAAEDLHRDGIALY